MYNPYKCKINIHESFTCTMEYLKSAFVKRNILIFQTKAYLSKYACHCLFKQ